MHFHGRPQKNEFIIKSIAIITIMIIKVLKNYITYIYF